jgi:tetratricopeptide (TPR) repeat protein
MPRVDHFIFLDAPPMLVCRFESRPRGCRPLRDRRLRKVFGVLRHAVALVAAVPVLLASAQTDMPVSRPEGMRIGTGERPAGAGAAQSSFSMDDPVVLRGQAAYGAGNYAEAAAAFEAAYRTSLAALGERHPLSLTVMSRLAQAYGGQGRTTEQLALNEKVLRLRTETLGERHPDTLSSINNLAVTYAAQGRLAEQLALFEKALRLRSEVLGLRHRDTLKSMGNLAASYSALGRTTEQLALNEKVLGLSIEVLGERHPDTLTIMNNLAGTYGELGRTAEELALDEKVVRLRAEVLGERHPDTLTSMSNLATCYGGLGRMAERLALNQKVLMLRTELLGEQHPDTLESMNNLASTYGAMGRTEEAVALDEKVLTLRTEILGEQHPDTLTSMNNLASRYGAVGRVAERLALNEKVRTLRHQILGGRHPDTLDSMASLAQAYGEFSRTSEALDLHKAVLDLRTETLGDKHPDTLASTMGLARIHHAGGRPKAAAALSHRYVVGAEWQRGQPGLSIENRQSVFRNYAMGYRFFGNAHAAVGEVARGLHLSELGKARTLLEGMAAQRATRSGVLLSTEQQQLEDLNRQVGALDQQIAQTQGGESRQGLEVTRNALVREYEALQAQLKARYPKYAQLSEVKVLGANDLSGVIPADALAVSYVQDDDRVSAYLLDSGGNLRWMALGSMPGLADAVEIVRLAQSDFRSSPGETAQNLPGLGHRRAWRLADGSYRILPADQLAPVGAQALRDSGEVMNYLAARLLKPLARRLQRKPRWIISPDGPLAQLAFETLPFGKHLLPAVASAEIHYTQSLSVYALSRALQQQYRGLHGRQSLLAMGHAHYESLPQSAPSVDVGAGKAARNGLRNLDLRDEGQLRDLDDGWVELPGTEREVKSVAALFPGSASVFLREQATEQQLQALNREGLLKNYRFLLLSAHGYLSAQQPVLSSIVLGLRHRTPEADGYITASEWPAYDLRSDLTVLSACDTAVGKVLGGEGVMGLPFALFVAGNVNTVLSLWPVQDNATALFMQSLYTKLNAGQTAVAALTATKREFIKHSRFSHPVYWAPFILIGAG